MELRFHRLLQPGGRHSLRDSVRDSRNPENSGPSAMRLRYLHRHHRRRKVAARRHPIPDLVQIAFQIGLEVLDRAAVRPRRALIGLHLQPGVPNLLLRNVKRLALRFLLAHTTPPSRLVDRIGKPRMSRPLRSASTASSRSLAATTGRSACASRDGTQPLALHTLGELPIDWPGGRDCIGTRFPTFRTRAADQARAASAPGTTWPVTGHPPGSSRVKQ